MKYSVTFYLDKIEELLSECQGMTSCIRENPNLFAEKLNEWLLKGEKLFKEYNSSQSASFSALRAVVASIDDKASITSPNAQKRKMKRMMASEHFQNAVTIVNQVYEKEQFKIEQARDIISRAVLVAVQNNIINTQYQRADLSPEELQQVYAMLIARKELRNVFQQALTSVSQPDVLRLLDETLARISV